MTLEPSTVSVVMATYNGAVHLEEQLRSLVLQDRLPDELVVSDDGSSDRTLEILDEFARSAPFRVLVHRQRTNLGPDQNFASAIARASGDLVFCCDQDDRWHSDKILVMAAALEADAGVGMVMCDGRLVDEALRPLDSTIWSMFGFTEPMRDEVERGEGFAVFARRMPVYGCTIAFRGALLPTFMPVPSGVSFDSWIGQIVSVVAAVVLVRRPLIDYRQHASQVTGFDGRSGLRRIASMVSRSDVAAARKELQGLEALSARLALLPPGPGRSRAQQVTRSRVRLTARRVRAREARALRIPLILAGLVRGEYHRGAQGLRSAGVDLLSRRSR